MSCSVASMASNTFASYSFVSVIPLVSMQEPFVAELVPETGPVSSADVSSKRELDMALGATVAITIIFIILAAGFGHVVESTVNGESSENTGVRVPTWERHNLDYVTNMSHGFVMEFGSYQPLATANEWNSTHVFVEFNLPIEEGGSAPNGKVSLAYWRPDVPEGVEVPVIAEFGPYFNEASVSTPSIEVPGTWLGQMIIDQILPHGFAFAQVSVSGTGDSNHCMDLMGNAEQLGIDAAVTWLGEQEWSNGNVAMIGKSYDGSTPWQAAMFGNPHLATIVPISGLIGVKELMWRNGSSEARAPFMHNVVYGSYGIDGDSEDIGNMCPDYFAGPATGTAAYAFGSEVVGTYWQERYFLDRVLENYKGSIYIVQGMHDWNVDPHMAIPTINLLKDRGIESKGLFGQWDHDYPDRPDIMLDRSGPGRGGEAFPEMVRFDWMQDLLEWFDYYLKESGTQPGQWIEIQSQLGTWRLEERYPPEDTTEVRLALGGELSRISGGLNILPDATSSVVYESESLEEAMYIAGLPRLHVEVRTTTYGGQLYAMMEDCDESGACLHIGHAIMDLRYHEGGEQIQTWTPPLQSFTALMEFLPMDVEVMANHTIKLTLMSTGEDYLPASTSTIVTIMEGEGSTLQLDTYDIDDAFIFEVPGCTHEVCQ